LPEECKEWTHLLLGVEETVELVADLECKINLIHQGPLPMLMVGLLGMTIWHGMIKVVEEVKKFNKDMAVADKDNLDNNIPDNSIQDNSTQDNSIQDNSTQDNNKTATTSSELQLKVV